MIFGSAVLREDLGRHLGSGDGGFPHLDAGIRGQQKHLFQGDVRALFSRERLHLDLGPCSTRYCLPPVSTIAYI